jgi:hypothetical protein
LTVFGLPGQPGLHAQRLVVEVWRKEEDPAMEEFPVVEEKLVLDQAVRIEAVMSNAVVRLLYFNHPHKAIGFSCFRRMELLGILGRVFPCSSQCMQKRTKQVLHQPKTPMSWIMSIWTNL